MKVSQLVLQSRIAYVKRTLGERVLSPEEIIRLALSRWKRRTIVAWSGGKCSTAVLHLTLQQDPTVKVLFNNTGVEFPETVKYVHQIAKEWSLNFVERVPKVTFWKLVERYGFPQLRGKGGEGHRPRRPKCCEYLKERPAKQYYLKAGFKAIITGLRAEENRSRTLALAQRGQFYHSSVDKIWKYHPIALWSMKELDAYVQTNRIPLNPIYLKGAERCGCWPCTGFISWREQLKTVNPRMFKSLNKQFQKRKGEPTLWEFQDSEGCYQGIEKHGTEL